MEHIRFALNKIKPSKATKSIDETDIIVVTTNRSLRVTPYIGINELKWEFLLHDSKEKKAICDFCLVDMHHKLHYLE